MDNVQVKSFFQNWFDSRDVSRADNDNVDVNAFRAWARSRSDSPTFAREVAAAKEAADQAFRFNFAQNNR